MRQLVAARLRHQPAQAVLVAALAAVVSLSAVLGIAYARAVEESVEQQTFTSATASERGVSLSQASESPASPQQLLASLAPALRAPVFGTPVAGASADGLAVVGKTRVLAPVLARDGVCGHLTALQGRCPSAVGEVMVSRRAVQQLDARVGATVAVADGGGNDAKAILRLHVVGVYGPYDTSQAYWFDRASAQTPVVGGKVEGGDALFVTWDTLHAAAWRTLTTSVDVPTLAARITVDSVPAVRRALAALTASAHSAKASSSTQLPVLLATAQRERDQARAPLPLLALQVVLLSLVVLGYVAAATTEQRRPEVALARLRGQQPRAAAGFLMRELGVLVVGGALVGGLAGWGVARLAAQVWLAPGVGVPLRWPMPVAVAAAALAGLGAATLVAVPTVREPLVTLLRSVPPRSSALRAGIGDGVVVALCVAGLVTLRSGRPGDPTALVAPGLLALAGGLLLSQVVVPGAAAVGRLQLRRGRLRSALAAVAVARRPALRRLVAIVTVAVALLVFAVGAGAVAADQRRVAASHQVGAPVVLTVTADTPAALAAAVRHADPTGRYATPVLVGRAGSDEGPRSMAVDPAQFAAIALWGRSGVPGQGAPAQLAVLATPQVAPIQVHGTSLTLQVSLVTTPIQPNQEEQLMLGPGGIPAVAGVQRPLGVELDLVPARGELVQSPQLQVHPGDQTVTVPVACSDGCKLRQVRVVRDPADLGGADIRATVAVRDSTGTVDLRTKDAGWSPVSFFSPVQVVPSSGPSLSLRSRSFGSDLGAHRDDVPLALPALVAGEVPPAPYYGASGVNPESLVSASSPTGDLVGYERVGTLPSVPGAPGPVVLVPFGPGSELGAPLSSRALQQVWLGADDGAREARLVAALRQSGVGVRQRDSVAGTADRLAGQGPALALRLAAIAGVVALVLAACVLAVSVATSGRVRAHDLAGLRVVGVPRRVVASAAVREQLAVATIGVLAGGVLGAAGAALTLSRTVAGGGLPDPDVSTAWPGVLVGVLASAVVLGLVCAVLGRRLAARAVPELLLEGAR